MSSSLDTMAAVDKLTRVRHLIGVLESLDDPEGNALSELGWTLRERMDDALATLDAELATLDAERKLETSK